MTAITPPHQCLPCPGTSLFLPLPRDAGRAGSSSERSARPCHLGCWPLPSWTISCTGRAAVPLWRGILHKAWGGACGPEAASPSFCASATPLPLESPPRHTPRGPSARQRVRRPRPDAWASPRAPGSYLRPGTGTVTAALSACARPALVPRQAASDASALFAPCGEERGRSVEGPSLSPNTWVHPSSAGHGGDRKQRTAAGRQGLRAASVSGGRSSLSAEPEGLSSPQERQRPSPHLGLRRDRTEATILCTSLPRPRPQPVFLRRPHCAPLSLWGSVP